MPKEKLSPFSEPVDTISPVRRYVFAADKSYFFTIDKVCAVKGSKLVLHALCLFTTASLASKGRSPLVGDVVMDIYGNRLEIIEINDPL